MFMTISPREQQVQLVSFSSALTTTFESLNVQFRPQCHPTRRPADRSRGLGTQQPQISVEG